MSGAHWVKCTLARDHAGLCLERQSTPPGDLQVQLGADHRLWCGLFTSDTPRCTCGQLTVEQLVAWHVNRATTDHPNGRRYPTSCGKAPRRPVSKGR